MAKITEIEKYRVDRSKYEFAKETILLKDEYGNPRKFICIVLREEKSKDIIYYTGLERYVIDLGSREPSETTYDIAVSRVNGFLNYILHTTKLNSLNEVTENEIREYLLERRMKSESEDIKSGSWTKIRTDVMSFLSNYYLNNKDIFEFHYEPDKYIEALIVKEKTDRGTKKHVVTRYKSLGIKKPKGNDNKHRKRTIMYGHLKALLYAAKKYDPMIYLAICIMAYAGLREGEVVNLSFDDIKIEKRIGVVKKVTLGLWISDKFRTGKTHTGVIKKLRDQEIYDDFLDDFEDALEFHKDYLESKGLPTEGESAVFYNKQNRPLSVTSLLDRIKDLFETHFLRILSETSENMPFEGETYAFIEAYQDEYPGAHMLRHWFTMYLITKAKLRPELVRKWRGDEPNSDSYEQYMHLNYDLIEAYKKTAYGFQENLIKEIYV
ncbi:tyrosine-type recombinase/integrase [Butyrivibrio fibrisolvens]|uniref:tyrosine-type recombinase/integrase n=1 Tax=Butyrivibrio fibrisolvens TaxID=831 RepID=UPI0003B60157|nr:tyrosine-type recombinase/integrase [Butyrivibrio fibrisolvens]